MQNKVLSPPPEPEIRGGQYIMPADLQEQLAEIEVWAQANRKEARQDTVSFWILKIPAIIASAGSGILAYIDIKLIALIAGFIAAVCVLIDSVYPRGMLRNTHLRAYHDLRILTSHMVSQWRFHKDHNDLDAAKRIIREAEPERNRIACYIRDAETALDVKKGP